MQNVTDSPSSDPVLERLDRILNRLEAMESRLAAVEAQAHELPGIAATAINTLDEYFGQKSGASSDLPERLLKTLELFEKVATPENLTTLGHLAKHSEALMPWLGLLGDVPGMLNVSVDTFDETMNRLKEGGVDVLTRSQQLGVLLNLLSEPHTISLLTQLMQQRDSLQMLTELVRDAPGIVSMIVDTGDELFRRYQRSGEDFEHLMYDLRHGVLNAQSVAVVAAAGQSLAQSARDCEPAGPMRLLGALREPEFRRGLGFLLSFVRHFSHSLDTVNHRRV